MRTLSPDRLAALKVKVAGVRSAWATPGAAVAHDKRHVPAPAHNLVTLSMKNGSKLPAGVTWSNRAELIKANEVRGHAGFNFDRSSLIAGKQATQ